MNRVAPYEVSPTADEDEYGENISSAPIIHISKTQEPWNKKGGMDNPAFTTDDTDSSFSENRVRSRLSSPSADQISATSNVSPAFRRGSCNVSSSNSLTIPQHARGK